MHKGFEKTKGIICRGLLVLGMWSFGSELFNQTLRAQSPSAQATDVEVALVVGEAYERHAIRKLKSFLPEGAFRVDLNVQLKQQPPRMPYQPQRSYINSLALRPIELLDPYVSKLEINVFLSSKVASQSSTAINQILAKTLMLDGGRGDVVNFADLGISISAEDSEKQAEILQMQVALKEQEDQLKKLDKERDDVKTELSIARADLEKELIRSRVAENNPSGSPAGALRPTDDLLFQYGLLVTFALLFLAFIGVIWKGFSKLQAGYLALAQALKGGGGGREGQESSLRGVSEVPELAVSQGSAQLQAIHERILVLHEELLSSMSAIDDHILTSYLSKLLERPGTVERAVATMEVLGAAKANQLYQKLGRTHQAQIIAFLQIGIYSRSKPEVMLEAGEILKTRLIIDSRASSLIIATPGIKERLAKLSPLEAMKLIGQLDGETLSRYLCYLDAQQIVEIVQHSKRHLSDRFEDIINALPALVAVAQRQDLDVPLLARIDAEIMRRDQDQLANFLPLYQEIVEMLSDEEELEQKVRSSFAASDARVEEYLESNLINLQTMFQLSTERFAELLTLLSNSDLAALLLVLDETSSAKVAANLSLRRRDVLSEVIEETKSLSSEKQSQLARELKRKVITILRDWRSKNKLDLETEKPEAKANLRIAG